MCPLRSSTATFALAVMLAGLGSPAAGQVTELIEVRVVNVDVTVSDRKGRPVAGLERHDFEVRVDGAAVEVVNFYAVERRPATSPQRGASAALPTAGTLQADGGARPLQLAILVDSSNVEAHARNEGLEQVRDFLHAHLGPGDRVMLAPEGRTGVAPEGPPVTFTDRLDLVERGLDEIAAMPARDRRLREFREILQDIGVSLSAGNASVRGRMRSLEARIRAFSAEASRDTARAAGDLRGLVDRLAGLSGRKAILYLGGGLSLRPGEALTGALTQALGRYAALLPEGARVPDLPVPSADNDSGTLRALARYASVRGVAFYAVALGDSAPGAAVTLSGGSVGAGSGSVPGQEESWAPAVGVSRQFDLKSSLQLLAGATGGRLADGHGAVRLLDRLLDDARAFYSLGIQPPAGDPGEVHRLRVRVRGRGLRVRHREAFRTLSRDEEDANRMLSALVVEEERGPFPAPSLPVATGADVGPSAPDSVGARSTDPSALPPEDRSTVAKGRKARRRYRLPADETAAGYRQALRLLADGETVAARTALRELETGAAGHAVYDQLERIESLVLLELEQTVPDSLLPVALLHADLLPIYRRLGLAPLAEHALRMSKRLAETVASQGSSAARAVAGRALTELAGDLLRAGRLGECQELFELALEVDGDPDAHQATARLGLGFSHERLGRYEQAAEILGPLAEQAHPEASLRLALNLERLGKTDRSRPLLATLIGAASSRREAKETSSRREASESSWIPQLAAQETARIAIRASRFEEASSVLTAALERWPDHPGLRVQQAFVLDRRGAPRQARDQVARLVAAGATGDSNPRDRYNRWPASDAARRELRVSAEEWLVELGRASGAVAP